jgi:FKBP-type peptidyl-prolyl cis-trans isomerase 2
MEITRQCVVALTWTLKDTLGEMLDELKDPVEFLVGGDDLLARIALRLKLTVVSVRVATDDEVGRGWDGSGVFMVQPYAPLGATLH